jgi:hypothetical protein
MTVNYDNVWKTMNDVESVTAKICSAREILDCAIDAHEQHKHDKVEHLLHAIDEFLVYYLQEFDDKFKKAWAATVGDLREGDVKDDGMRPWGHSDLEYQIANQKKDKLKKWTLPVEQIYDDYFISFPDDLLDAANLKEGDNVEWVDNGDGSYSLKKVNPTTYDEMIAAGLTMTADGFWIKE